MTEISLWWLWWQGINNKLVGTSGQPQRQLVTDETQEIAYLQFL